MKLYVQIFGAIFAALYLVPAYSDSLPQIDDVYFVSPNSSDNNQFGNESAAKFYGGISVDGGSVLLNNQDVQQGQTIAINGKIIPAPEHGGQEAEIVVVGLYLSDNEIDETAEVDNCDVTKGSWYMNTRYGANPQDNQYCNWISQSANGEMFQPGAICNNRPTLRRGTPESYWNEWNGKLDPNNLRSLYTVQLPSDQTAVEFTVDSGKVLYRDAATYTGQVCIHFGYRLVKDGTLVFNGNPVTYRIKAKESEIRALPVVDPNTELGVLAANEAGEAVGIFGGKDSEGRLTSIERIVLTSPFPNNSMEIVLDKNYRPQSLKFPDNSRMDLHDYTDEGATATYYDKDGNQVGQGKLPLPMDKVNNAVEKLQQYVDSPQPTQNNPEPSLSKEPILPTNSVCTDTVNHFYKALDEFVWAVFQLASVYSCSASVAPAIISGGIAIPLAVWACSSVILNGVDKLADAITKGNSPFKRLNDLNSVASAASCLITKEWVDCARGLAPLLMKLGLKTTQERTLEICEEKNEEEILSCVKVFKTEVLDKRQCYDPRGFMLYYVNECSITVDVQTCLRNKTYHPVDGWDCGLKLNVEVGQEAHYYTCRYDGEYRVLARDSRTFTQFPPLPK